MKKIDIDKTPDEICFRPMIFSTPMVRSLLNRTKTQTRRIMNPRPFLYKEFSSKTGYREWYGLKDSNDTNTEKWIQFSNIKINDTIWVRETFSNGYINNEEHTEYKYKANGRNYNVLWKSLYMQIYVKRSGL